MRRERQSQETIPDPSAGNAAATSTDAADLLVQLRARAGLPTRGEGDEAGTMALVAAWPEPVLQLSENERSTRVRRGQDTVLLDGPGARRGFVRAVLRVPLGHPEAAVYGVFVEVERDAYLQLKQAYETRSAVRVTGRLATRLPTLEDAYESLVEVLEDGSDLRARIVSAHHPWLREGVPVGPRAG